MDIPEDVKKLFQDALENDKSLGVEDEPETEPIEDVEDVTDEEANDDEDTDSDEDIDGDSDSDEDKGNQTAKAVMAERRKWKNRLKANEAILEQVTSEKNQGEELISQITALTGGSRESALDAIKALHIKKVMEEENVSEEFAKKFVEATIGKAVINTGATSLQTEVTELAKKPLYKDALEVSTELIKTAKEKGISVEDAYKLLYTDRIIKRATKQSKDVEAQANRRGVTTGGKQQPNQSKSKTIAGLSPDAIKLYQDAGLDLTAIAKMASISDYSDYEKAFKKK